MLCIPPQYLKPLATCNSIEFLITDTLFAHHDLIQLNVTECEWWTATSDERGTARNPSSEALWLGMLVWQSHLAYTCQGAQPVGQGFSLLGYNE